MENLPRPVSPTVRAHKRQLVWQILVPMIVAVLLIAAVGALVIGAGAPHDRLGADVATIWLVAPLLGVAVGMLAFLCLVIYGMARLLQVIPRFSGKVQDVAGRIAGGTRKIADGAAEPFLWIHEAVAVVASFLKKL